MFTLVPFMIEKIGIILIVALLLSQLRSFRKIIQNEQSQKDKVLLLFLFGLFGIISNYTGIEVFDRNTEYFSWHSFIDDDDAIANTRVLGIVIGGLIGGPVVGIGAGLIAGIHRYFLGGFTAFACSISTIIAGVVAGYLGKKRGEAGKKITVGFAVLIGMIMESLQMLIILLIAKPYHLALELVGQISFPMIVINGLGTMLFMFIIEHAQKEDVRMRVLQTDTAFSIADKTLPYFREGLNIDSCKKISEIILNKTEADAVAITDEHMVLAHVGTASDHHKPFLKPETKLTNRVLITGKVDVARSKAQIGCWKHDCPLNAAIVIPLKVKKKIAGTLKLYYKNPAKLDQVQEHLANGLAELFSTQLELVEVERQAKLLKDAEIKALHSQIHPHFLFNSLNTISALCRTNPEKARELLLQLSSFFRGNIHGARKLFLPLKKEIEVVHAYIAIVQTRFPEKFQFHFQVEPTVENCLVPPFILQPLVENAVNYGFPGSKTRGDIYIRIYPENNLLNIVIEDNGKGIASEKLNQLGKKVVPSKKGNGTAIFNIFERLKGLYNRQASMNIESKEEVGTKISITIPINREGEVINA